MAEEARSALIELARHLNDISCSTLEEDGTHAAMFFLAHEDGGVEAHLFDEGEERRVGDARGRQIAEAVAETGADAVVCVSEAWSSALDDVPEGGGPGDAPEARDVLLVVAVDRDGNGLALETPIDRAADGTVEVGATEFHEDYRLDFLEPVKAVWAR